MKKILIAVVVLFAITGCTIIIKPDCKCECPSKNWYWYQQNTVPCEPFGDGCLVPNSYTLPNLEGYEFKIN